MTSQESVQATVFQKVARSGLQPCRSTGVSTTPFQKSAWLRTCHSSSSILTETMQGKQINGIEPREAGDPEVALVERLGAVGIVIRKDVAGDQEEDADEDVAAVDEGVEQAQMRRREVEEHNTEREQRANAGQGRQGRLAESDGCGGGGGDWQVQISCSGLVVIQAVLIDARRDADDKGRLGKYRYRRRASAS